VGLLDRSGLVGRDNDFDRGQPPTGTASLSEHGDAVDASGPGGFKHRDQIARLPARTQADQQVTRPAEPFQLADEDLVPAVIVSDARHEGAVTGQGDRGQGNPVSLIAADQLGHQMLGLGRAAAVSAGDQFVAFLQGLQNQVAGRLDLRADCLQAGQGFLGLLQTLIKIHERGPRLPWAGRHVESETRPGFRVCSQQRIGREFGVPAMPFFDHNATAPLHPVARAAWLAASDDGWQNPGAPYRSSARVHARLEDARKRMADTLGASPDRIVFTSGATESNNAAIAFAASGAGADDVIAVSPTEHPSVIEAARHHWGGRVVWLRVDRAGGVDPDHLLDLLRRQRPRLVCIMAANNETGVLAPIGRLASLCQEAGASLLCDATQWLGKLPVDTLTGADFLTGSGHKFGAPKGVGFVRIPPGGGFSWMRGGHQENGHRAGTENIPSIEAMVVLLEHLAETALPHRERAEEMKRRFEDRLALRIPGSRVLGPAAERLWNTVSVVMPEGENGRWVRKLDRLGFEVSTGSACASGSDAPSHVLAAMEIPAPEARRTLRISSGWETDREDWSGLEEAMVEVSTGLASAPVVRITTPRGRER